MKTLETRVSVMANQIENIEKSLIRIENTINKNAEDFNIHAEKELAIWTRVETKKADLVSVQNLLKNKADASLKDDVMDIKRTINRVTWIIVSAVIIAILSGVIINFNTVKNIL